MAAGVVSVSIALVAVTAIPALAGPADTRTVRISVSAAGEQSSEPSFLSGVAGVSDGGRFTAFTSFASDLVPGVTNRGHVYVHDALAGTTALASVSTTGEIGNFRSGRPSISADGRYVAFESAAWNLVRGDTNARPDVFVRDMVTGTTTLASVNDQGDGGELGSEAPVISADGRYVTFLSYARNLVPGDTNGTGDLFVRDLAEGTTTRITVSTDGEQAASRSSSFDPSRVMAGRYVAFRSDATNLVAGDTNEATDVFVRDLVAGTTVRAGVSTAGVQADMWTEGYSITADGRHVVFESRASNLVEGDTVDSPDVFRRDLLEGTTELIDLDEPGVDEDLFAYDTQISPEGRRLIFTRVGVSRPHYLRDLGTGVTTVATVGADGSPGNSWTREVAFSTDGRAIAFDSGSTNLVAGDTNGTGDVFMRVLD